MTTTQLQRVREGDTVVVRGKRHQVTEVIKAGRRVTVRMRDWAGHVGAISGSWSMNVEVER